MRLIILQESGPVFVCKLNHAEILGGVEGDDCEDELIVECLIEREVPSVTTPWV